MTLPRRTFLASAATAALLARPARATAGEFNTVLSYGDPAPAWTDLPGVDGKKHSLADLAAKQAVVLCFTCNSCDSARDYEDRIIDFAKRRCGPDAPVAFVAVNVNLIEEDSPAEMKKRAEERKFPFPYLHDASQKLARDYGATYTPEFFILDADRKIAYLGGFDDSSKLDFVRNKHLEPALDAVLAGKKPALVETTALGCLIRYARTRRRP